MNELNLKSSRAGAARLAVAINWWVRAGLLFAAIGLVAGGIYFLLLSFAAGWLLIGLAALPVMVLACEKYGLRNLAVDNSTTTLDGQIEVGLLGRLSPHKPLSPYAVAEQVGRVLSGQFMSARFGVTPNLLLNISSKDPADLPALTKMAHTIAQKLNTEQITAAVFAVALVELFDRHEDLLAHMSLDIEALYSGIRWYEDVQQKVKHHSRRKRTGGVARDWSFGYVPTLQRFGTNISEQIAAGQLTVDLEAHHSIVDQMLATFSNGGRQNIALIGGQGSGKSTLVRVFAERILDPVAKIPSSLKYRQIFTLDASALISSAPGRGELENLVNRVLGEAYSAKNVIVFLDNAQLFFEEGVGSVDMSNLLLPILEAGRLRIILAMDEQRFLQISQRNSSLAGALNRIMVKPASQQETMDILQDQLIIYEYQRKVTYMYQALEEVYRLSERYLHDMVMPGRAVRLLETAAAYAEDGFVTKTSVQQAIEQTMDIKVGAASTSDEKSTLLNLEDLIHRRMINQTRAVQVVSDALRRARSGIRNQNRPIGTFLFLGPTGVGKTELSKALADVYFGGEERLIRLDLNEYVRPEDVTRLIADGAQDSSSLTAQIMKQPFSVVLLDEIEKAHPQVLTTLLQLLDEGVLRDINNKEVSFRDAIIIATSNAGADRIREYIERGYKLEQFEQQFTDELIQSNQFRPEFLNRFDEIVIFRPLDKLELLQVVDLILAGINKTLEPQRITIQLEEAAKKALVDAGYDPRLGARPMRRMVQRAVENTIARQMLSGEAQPGSQIVLSAEQVERTLALR
ncbi:ATP-dependent Clp protease ATP-binding subunit [Candidatus Saccharibacteria bacterium]|nr:ATP-dependent Clp protease ATP-binding subunit [Candidatus Saccharibacteria bacterium]